MRPAPAATAPPIVHRTFNYDYSTHRRLRHGPPHLPRGPGGGSQGRGDGAHAHRPARPDDQQPPRARRAPDPRRGLPRRPPPDVAAPGALGLQRPAEAETTPAPPL